MHKRKTPEGVDVGYVNMDNEKNNLTEYEKVCVKINDVTLPYLNRQRRKKWLADNWISLSIAVIALLSLISGVIIGLLK